MSLDLSRSSLGWTKHCSPSRRQKRIQTVKDMMIVGDVLKVFGGIYFHFAVYIGDGNLIHVSGDKKSKHETFCRCPVEELDLTSTSDYCTNVPCRHRHRYFVETITYEEFTQDCKFVEFDNRVDTYKPAMVYSSDEIVRRAKSMLGRCNYKVCSLNCEHFVYWCRNGMPISRQTSIYWVVSSLLCCAPVEEWNSYSYVTALKDRNPNDYEKVPLCELDEGGNNNKCKEPFENPIAFQNVIINSNFPGKENENTCIRRDHSVRRDGKHDLQMDETVVAFKDGNKKRDRKEA